MVGGGERGWGDVLLFLLKNRGREQRQIQWGPALRRARLGGRGKEGRRVLVPHGGKCAVAANISGLEEPIWVYLEHLPTYRSIEGPN